MPLDASSELTRYGRAAASVFDLLGHDEVDLTAAVGWTLANSPALMRALLDQLGIDSALADDATVALETADEKGRTDIELTGSGWRVVIEAKKGWLLPGETQLNQYLDRLADFDQRLLVSMSDSSAAWAAQQLGSHIAGVPVRHEPWDTIRKLIKAARRTARTRERLWLEELEDYMGRATSLRPYDEQWVYCVAVSGTTYGSMSFKDYVRQERVYFHPYGGRNGWPKRPLTFLAFRWQGVVRQVNRVESYEVVSDLRELWPAITNEDAGQPHIVYRLGPDIPIPPAIRTTGTYANGRVWVLLDQLLTHPTLKEAVDASKRLQDRLG